MLTFLKMMTELVLAATSLTFFNENRPADQQLCIDPTLVAAADAQNLDMRGDHGFNHADDLADLLPPEYPKEALGEILGRYDSSYNYGNVAQVINNGWQHSPGHWAIITNPVYKCVGISYQQDENGIWWVTARFSSKDSSLVASEPLPNCVDL